MESNLPVRSEQHLDVVAEWSPRELAEQFAVRTTLPDATEQDRILLLSIIDGDVDRGEEHIGDILDITDFICHPVTVRRAADGELIPAARTIIMCKTHRPLSFVSGTILKSLDRLAWSRKQQGPWDPPIIARLRQKASKQGRVYSLVPEMGS